jgi:hypothetical protein
MGEMSPTLFDAPTDLMRATKLHWGLYAQIDAYRQWQGKILDALGLGPVQTPSRIVFTIPGERSGPMSEPFAPSRYW